MSICLTFDLEDSTVIEGVDLEDTSALKSDLLPLWFFKIAKNNPFRRTIVECGDSVVGVSQPLAKITTRDSANRWMTYLGHEGD